jgi:hypothetical protein
MLDFKPNDERNDFIRLEIVFIKNKCHPQLPKLTVLQQNPPIFNVLEKLEEKA